MLKNVASVESQTAPVTSLAAPAASNDLLDTVKAAEVLDLKPATLEVWRSTNKHPSLRYLKIGGKVRYRRSDLNTWLEQQTIGAAA